MKNLLLIGGLVNLVTADQPVHCLRESVYGSWDFFVSKDVQNVNIYGSEEICTHRMPNRLQFINKNYKFHFAQQDVWKVNLMDNYKVEALKCEGSSTNCIATKHIRGRWSPIYAQSLLVELDNGLRFISNFKYTLKDSYNSDLIHNKNHTRLNELSTESEDAFDMRCNETMVGFVQDLPQGDKHPDGDMKSMKTVCFHGVQTKSYNVEKTQQETPKDQDNMQGLKFTKIIQHNKTASAELSAAMQFQQKNSTAVKPKQLAKGPKKADRINHHLSHVPSDEMDLLISAINNADIGWRADTCKLQSHHENYCQKDTTLLAQQDQDPISLAGTKEFAAKGDKQFQDVLKKVQKYQKMFKNSDDIPDAEIPVQYDFRNIEGYDFTNPVRDQGHCGSCYTEAFNQAVESRLKIKYGKKVPMLSAQHVLSCNFLTEGCQGGWPHLNGFFAEQAYLVSDKCAPYQAKTKGVTCKQFEKCAPEAKVLRTRYVGGGWGEVSEKQMMKEILMNGPVSVEFQANKLFQSYSDGILSEKGVIALSDELQASGKEALQKSLQSLAQELFGQDPEKIKQLFATLDSAGPSQSTLVQTGAQIDIDSEGVPKLSDETLESKGFSWQNQNHSVLIVGWGYDAKKDTKYWIIRNSYSSNWGLDGDFLMKRGTNDFGVEADVVALDVGLCDPSNASKCVVV